MAQTVDKIETERLLLRGIDETDAESIVLWRSDPEVYKYFKSPHRISIEEHLEWYRERYLNDESRFDWICIEKGGGRKIGVFGISKGTNEVEVNYLLSPEAQHKGYATEAIKGLIGYTRSTWNCNRIKAEIHGDNKSSIALIKRLGFDLESTNTPFCIYMIDLPLTKQQESL